MIEHVFYIGDVIDTLKKIPDESVQCVVTSPPYWGLRDYGIKGQLGLEETPEEYVANMVKVFREVKRVLRVDGTLWLNLGDSFASNTKGSGGHNPKQDSNKGSWTGIIKLDHGIKPKDLVGIPWRVAFALQADGWWLRSDIIWGKPSPMPESVTDRPTKAHEYVFLLTKSERYFYDNEAIKEDCVDGDPRSPRGSIANPRLNSGLRYTPLAKRNKRSVWNITTKPFPGAHFAVFPPEIPEICIKAGTSEKGCCPKCGAPWERVVETPRYPKELRARPGDYGVKVGYGDPMVNTTGTGQKMQNWRKRNPPETTGWQPTCSCGIKETTPCTVLDPFGGSGTVSMVAKELGRASIYIDLNPDYAEMAIKRCDFGQGGLFENHVCRLEGLHDRNTSPKLSSNENRTREIAN